MRLRLFIGSLLLTLLPSIPLFAQPPSDRPGPVTIQQIRRALNYTPEISAEIERTNAELIQAIKARGVNFVLLPEEEWALTLREASDELIDAIRHATPPDERARLLLIREQERLYFAFQINHNRSDVASRRIAVDAGKEFIVRYRTDASVADKVAYLQKAIPALERSLRIRTRPQRSRRRTN